MIQEEKKAAHAMMIRLVTWVCVSMWGFPCTSIRVISSGVTQTIVATVSLNGRTKIKLANWVFLNIIMQIDAYPKFEVRLMRK